jgi:hypothetical protein
MISCELAVFRLQKLGDNYIVTDYFDLYVLASQFSNHSLVNSAAYIIISSSFVLHTLPLNLELQDGHWRRDGLEPSPFITNGRLSFLNQNQVTWQSLDDGAQSPPKETVTCKVMIYIMIWTSRIYPESETRYRHGCWSPIHRTLGG